MKKIEKTCDTKKKKYKNVCSKSVQLKFLSDKFNFISKYNNLILIAVDNEPTFNNFFLLPRYVNIIRLF